MTDKQVSIIIPTYYRNEQLTNTLKSVQRQEYDYIETIVIDDSGERHAKRIVDEFPSVDYVGLNENIGPPKARQRGLSKASGDFIQFLDDDEKIKPDKLSKQVKLFVNSDDIGVVYCGIKEPNGNTVLPLENGKGDVLSMALNLEIRSCVTSTMLIRSDLINKLPDTPGSDDAYLKIMLAEKTKFDYIPEVLVVRQESQNHRSDSIGAIEGMYGLLDTFDYLYDEYPDSTRNKARAKCFRREADFIIQQYIWSSKASHLFIKALAFHPNPPIGWYCLFISSLFGRTIYTSFKSVSQYITR